MCGKICLIPMSRAEARKRVCENEKSVAVKGGAGAWKKKAFFQQRMPHYRVFVSSVDSLRSLKSPGRRRNFWRRRGFSAHVSQVHISAGAHAGRTQYRAGLFSRGILLRLCQNDKVLSYPARTQYAFECVCFAFVLSLLTERRFSRFSFWSDSCFFLPLRKVVAVIVTRHFLIHLL